MTNPIPDSLLFPQASLPTANSSEGNKTAYTRCINAIEKRIGTTALVTIEMVCQLSIGISTGKIVYETGKSIVLNSINPIFSAPFLDFVLKTACLTLVTWSGMALYQKFKKEDVITKIEQIKQESKNQAKQALILQSSDGLREMISASLYERRLVSQLQELKQTHQIHQEIISNEAKLLKILSKYLEKYEIIWFRGHSNSEGMDLGDFFLSTEEVLLIAELARKAKPGATILFDGCNIGEGENNFAKRFSIACPAATIYASQSSHQMLYGLHFKPGFVPAFRDLMGRDSTRVYQNGVLMNPPTDSKKWSETYLHPLYGLFHGHPI